MLQNSGAISLADIQTEMGGANPITINEYYTGNSNGYVLTAKANGTNVSLVSTGAIKFSDFYGVFKSLVITYSTPGTFTQTVANGAVLLNTYAISGSGGGGGGHLVAGKGGSVFAGGGGGSGGANIMLSKAVVGSQTFSVNVGTGGVGGATSTTTGVAGTAGASSNLRGGIWGAVIPSSGGGGGGAGGGTTATGAGGAAGTGLTVGIAGNTGGAGMGGYGISVGATDITGPFIRAAGSGGSANGTGGGNGGCKTLNTDPSGNGANGLVVLVFR